MLRSLLRFPPDRTGCWVQLSFLSRKYWESLCTRHRMNKVQLDTWRNSQSCGPARLFLAAIKQEGWVFVSKDYLPPFSFSQDDRHRCVSQTEELKDTANFPNSTVLMRICGVSSGMEVTSIRHGRVEWYFLVKAAWVYGRLGDTCSVPNTENGL